LISLILFNRGDLFGLLWLLVFHMDLAWEHQFFRLLVSNGGSRRWGYLLVLLVIDLDHGVVVEIAHLICVLNVLLHFKRGLLLNGHVLVIFSTIFIGIFIVK
jgi:hypothetical protein